jgi:hypothetical protein
MVYSQITRQQKLTRGWPEIDRDRLTLTVMADPGLCVDCVPSQEGTISHLASPSRAKPYDPLDMSTFIPPTAVSAPSVVIEFCDRVGIFSNWTYH